MPTGAAAQEAAASGRKQSTTDNEDKGPGSVAGNLTDDPELRYTPSGRVVASLRIACSERVKDDKTGEWKDGPTAFYSITAWGRLAENAAEHMARGDRIVAEGRWTANRWEDKEGEIRERIVLTAHDLGPSMLFHGARTLRPRAGEQ